MNPLVNSNGLALAYLGDSIYEAHIRYYVLSCGISKVNNAHKKVTQFTSGTKQAKFVHYFLENNILTEEEIVYFKRGRNSHVNSARKNISIQDYLDATGFEAVFGYLGLCENYERIKELINIIIKLEEE